MDKLKQTLALVLQRAKRLSNLSSPNNQKAVIAALGLVVVGSVAFIGTRILQESHAAAVGTMYATPASATVTPGGTISVAIREESGTNLVTSAQSFMTYDPAKLQVTSVTDSPAFPTVLATSTTTPGQVRIARGVPFGGAPVSGDQLVATVNFKVLAASGTASVAFDNAGSMIVRAGDQANIMTGSTGATYTVSGSTSPATLSMSPASGTVGSTFSVAINATSTEAVTVVQSVIQYNASQLQYLGHTNSSAFPSATRSNTSTAGSLDFIRGVAGGAAGVNGTNTVLTVQFRVLTASGTTSLSFNNTASAIFRSDAQNIMTGSTGATFNLGLPAPTISTVSPASGPTTGGTTITITGTNFVSGANVKIGTVNATSVSFVSATSLQAVVPAQAASVKDVVVTNPDGQSVTKAGAFTYTTSPMPTVTAVTPNSGYILGGTVVTITGTNFASGSTVSFDTTPATSVVVVNSTTITAVAPPHAAGQAAVSVTSNGVTNGLKLVFTYKILGDTNGDNRVNGIDYSVLASHDGENYPAADFNADGVVGAPDLAILLASWTW